MLKIRKLRMASISDLPNEILLKIFMFYIETENQLDLMKVVSKVCLDWERICLSSSLWIKFDGTLDFTEMKSLIAKGCLNRTQTLIISPTEYPNLHLSDISVENIFSKLLNVEVIDFSNLEKLPKSLLSAVAKNCVKLKEIKFGAKRKTPICITYDLIVCLFSSRGSTFVKLDFSHCNIRNPSLLMRCVCDCCPNLEYLKMIGVENLGVFPTKYFQNKCPKLNVLHLDYNTEVKKVSHSSGFPNLKMFSYQSNEWRCYFDTEIKCLLFNSENLQFLSLPNCQVSADALCSLPASNVEYLYIPRAKVCDTNALSDVLKKWSHSLKELDISYGNNHAINKAVLNLVTYPAQSPLEFLNLKHTKIIPFVVEEVLKRCSHLETLQLDGCRSLKRGMKRTYNGTKELSGLRQTLETYRSAHPETVETIDIS